MSRDWLPVASTTAIKGSGHVMPVDNGSKVTNCLVFLPLAGPGRPLNWKGEGRGLWAADETQGGGREMRRVLQGKMLFDL